MKHLLACLVLVAILHAILVAATGEVEIGGLEDLLVATAPEGAGVGVYSIVGGLADEAEGSEVLVGCEVGSDVLVELCKGILVCAKVNWCNGEGKRSYLDRKGVKAVPSHVERWRDCVLRRWYVVVLA